MDEKLSDQSCTSGNSSISTDQEARITVNSDESSQNGVETGNIDEKSNGLMPKKGLIEGVEATEGRYSFVIDVKPGILEGENQRVCRICHLSKLENGKDLVDVIELGCGCKGELGFAHPPCAEAWFKQRGNRLCEICGQTVNNVTGVLDNSFLEEWNERRLTGGGASLSERTRGCWSGQPLCNFLMGCLVIAFVLPWLFRVNIFS